MGDKIAQLILDELFSSLENLETQTAAVLQFLKEKGGAARSSSHLTWSKREEPAASNVVRPG
jgi:hypothetical protein